MQRWQGCHGAAIRTQKLNTTTMEVVTPRSNDTL